MSIGNDLSVRVNAFCLIPEKRASNAPMSPAGTLCCDILSPPPGDSDVISRIERLSSIEAKIAPRSPRMALDASSRLYLAWLSPERAVATSLCQSAGRYPPPRGISNAVFARCRTRFENANGPEEREALYE